jgi:hypothetical protein
MRITSNNNIHLTYCTNIHPGEEWEKVFVNLKQYIPPLKAKLSPEKPFGIGLRLADIATRELLKNSNLHNLKSWLKKHDLYIFTLNGFPYGGFHSQVVKDQVYAPDWSKSERLDYTLRLVNILAELLPSGVDGSISTVPLSYKPWFKDNILLQASVAKSATYNLVRVVAEMVRIRIETGKLLHINLEPEPDALLENTAEVVNYFQKYLLPIGKDYLAKLLNIPEEICESQLLEHVRICYDTCHFAVEYENPISVFKQFKNFGIKIGKIQISAALRVKVPKDISERTSLKERLQPFAESTYLHQVVEKNSNNRLNHYSDLDKALNNLEKTTADEWRTHFHVPIFIDNYQLLQSTQDDIVTVLELVQNNPVCNHLEIETYTWEVLPNDMKLNLLASIQREYEWVLDKFTL